MFSLFLLSLFHECKYFNNKDISSALTLDQLLTDLGVEPRQYGSKVVHVINQQIPSQILF